MSVNQTDTVDHIGVSLDQELVLTISDHLPWEEADHLALLEVKICSYLQFIRSKQLLEIYPMVENQPLVIQIVLQYEPPNHAVVFLKKARNDIASEKIDLRWWVLSE